MIMMIRVFLFSDSDPDKAYCVVCSPDKKTTMNIKSSTFSYHNKCRSHVILASNIKQFTKSKQRDIVSSFKKVEEKDAVKIMDIRFARLRSADHLSDFIRSHGKGSLAG